MRATILMLASVMGLMLSGCTDTVMQAGAGGGISSVSKGKTSQELALEKQVKSLNQQSRDIIVRNTVEGAVVGALAGCFLAEISGDKCAKGALLGGAAGGVGGNVVGQKAAKANRDLVNQRAIIANLTGLNQKLNSVEGNLRRVVAAQNAEIRSLQRQLKSEQVSKAQYSSRVRAINSNRATLSSSLQRTEQNVAKSSKQLVKFEQQGGKKLTSSRRAAASTQSRVAKLRKSVSLAKIN
jgi:outer membrane lipoprotein SlyB